MSRQKLDFYAKVGTQEGTLVLVGKSDLANPMILKSEVLPLSFRLAAGEPRPVIEVAHSDGVQHWSA